MDSGLISQLVQRSKHEDWRESDLLQCTSGNLTEHPRYLVGEYEALLRRGVHIQILSRRRPSRVLRFTVFVALRRPMRELSTIISLYVMGQSRKERPVHLLHIRFMTSSFDHVWSYTIYSEICACRSSSIFAASFSSIPLISHDTSNARRGWFDQLLWESVRHSWDTEQLHCIPCTEWRGIIPRHEDRHV